jgi:hypothetical protein
LNSDAEQLLMKRNSLIELHPTLQFQLKTNITWAVAWNWYWRESTHYGIYAFVSGALTDPAGASHARYLGNQDISRFGGRLYRIQSSHSTLRF